MQGFTVYCTISSGPLIAVHIFPLLEIWRLFEYKAENVDHELLPLDTFHHFLSAWSTTVTCSTGSWYLKYINTLLYLNLMKPYINSKDIKILKSW